MKSLFKLFVDRATVDAVVDALNKTSKSVQIPHAGNAFENISYLKEIGHEVAAQRLFERCYDLLSDEQKTVLNLKRTKLVEETQKHTNDRIHRRTQLLEGYTERGITFETIAYELQQANKSNQELSCAILWYRDKYDLVKTRVQNAVRLLRTCDEKQKNHILEILEHHLFM